MREALSALLGRSMFVCLLMTLFTSVVWTWTGKATGQALVQLPTRFGIEDRAPDFVVYEDLARGRATFHSIVTGDFNGDGIGDFFVTNSLADGSWQAAGRAYVIFGKASLGSPGSINLASDQPDLTILGPGRFSSLGYGAAAGDLNGDGIDDIVLTSPSASAIYVIFGLRVFTTRVVDLSSDAADFVILRKVSEIFTSGLAVGDINGDGFNDLVFGRQGDDPTCVSILLGPFVSATTFDLAVVEADIVIRGRGFLDGFGFAIAIADVTGDGISDLVLGSPGAGREGAGAVDILMGSPAFERGVTISLSQTQADVTILGAFGGPDFGLGDGLGRVIAIADVNADGINDIVLGAPQSTRLGTGPGPTSAGEAYVVFGSHLLAGRLVDIRLGQQDLTIQGASPQAEGNHSEFGDLLGLSIAASDIDGDGVADMLIGAPGADGTKDSGEAYVVLGSAELISGDLIKISEGDQDITILARQSGGLLGTVVASGDVNGDGSSDLILEASNADGPGASQQGSGVIYIYFGGRVRPPEITRAKYKEGKSLLKVFGAELTGDVRVEINGVIINRDITLIASEGLLTLKGTRQELNLGSRPNQVVVIRKGTRSNSAKVKDPTLN